MAETAVNTVVEHYRSVWGTSGKLRRWTTGPVNELPADFGVLEIEPSKKRQVWTYATVGMAQPGDAHPLELHLFSPMSDRSLVELLTVTAHFHRTGEWLGAGHTVVFGRPWLRGSMCDHGLISLPYLDGPQLETWTSDNQEVSCLWLIPITRA